MNIGTMNGNGGVSCVPLEELCLPDTGTVDPTRMPDLPFRYVDISSVDSRRKRIVETKTLLGKEAPSRARQLIRANDVLVATTRPNLNAVAIVPPELDGAVCSTGFSVLRSNGCVEPEYLFAFVQSEQFVRSLSDLVKGALYPAVNDKQVRKQRMPLCEIPSQKIFVKRFREQLAEVERARAAMEEQLKATQSLATATLSTVFRKLESLWPRQNLGDALRLRKEVIHPRNQPAGNAIFVGLEHIESNSGRRIGSLPVDMAKLTGRKPQFSKGDIVYGYLRPYLNKVWIAEFDGLCSVDQYVYSVNQSKADTSFIAWFMRSAIYLERAPVDETPGWLPRIRTEEVASVEINLPPLPEQQRIRERIENELREITTIHNVLTERLATLQRMPAALLREAFSGKL